MLIEFIPVMLFILGWNAQDSGEISLQREPVLFASIQECKAASAAVLARVREADESIQYSARCVEFPDRLEMDELIKREFGQTQ